MAKIVNHFHTARFATDFLPPRDAGKTLERRVDLSLRHVIKSRRYRRHRSVAHIEFADERNFESLFPKLEPRAFSRVSDVSNSLGAIVRKADLNQLRETILCDFYAIGIIAIHQHHAILRNYIEQTPEAELDFIEVVKDVRVIELDVVYDQQFRQIMYEF